MTKEILKRLRERWWVFLLLILVYAGLKYFLGGVSEIPAGSGEEKIFELHARRFQYTPNILHVNKGDRVTIRLISEDVHHGFYLDGYEIQMSAIPGQEGAIRFVADKTGRYSFRCSVTCGAFHPYMIGYLKVGPNTRFYTGVGIILLIGLGMGGYLFMRKGGATV